MGSSLLGLVLDSSAVIRAERNKTPVVGLLESILLAHGAVELALSPVTVTELVHGIYRAKDAAIAERRRRYVEDVISLVPVHPITKHTAWLAGRIDGEEAAKGNVLSFNDLLIAVAAIEQGYGVRTGNVRHFDKVPGLTVVSR